MALELVLTSFRFPEKNLKTVFTDSILLLPSIAFKGKVYTYGTNHRGVPYFTPHVFPVFLRIIAYIATIAILTYFPNYIYFCAAAGVLKLTNAQNNRVYRLFLENERGQFREEILVRQNQIQPLIDNENFLLFQRACLLVNLNQPSPALNVESAPVSDSRDLGDCSVCFESIDRAEMNNQEKIRTLECTHSFHTSCITPWAERSNTCPTCRHPSERLGQLAPLRGRVNRREIRLSSGFYERVRLQLDQIGGGIRSSELVLGGERIVTYGNGVQITVAA